MRAGDLVADRFELLELAGEGGMGVVFRARDRQRGVDVALKLLRDETVWHEARRSRFAREARVLAELRHPNVVQYVAHGVDKADHYYLAMEWLEGEDLAARLQREGLTVDESLGVARQAASALAHAHAQGVVHRDLKPANLFLVDRRVDRVKVLDFGLARLRLNAEQAVTLTRNGVPIGTLGYMAPEQARGQSDVNASADVFSLGCVLFECLTGREVFCGDHILAVLAKIVLDDAPRVRELRPDVPRDVDRLVKCMLEKECSARFANGASLLSALSALGDRLAASGAPSIRPFGLTRDERVVLNAILMGQAYGLSADTLSAEELDDLLFGLRARADAYDARLEPLADGSLVLTLLGHEAASDQASRAARCALDFRTALPNVPMALATGWGVAAGRLPVGEVVDRAARLLALESAPHSVRIDDVTAGLLPPRFQLGGDAGGLTLLAERDVAEPARVLLGKRSPCVGRRRELGALEAIAAECAGESVSRAVLITGPAGIGKSRLRYELVKRLEAPGDAELWIARGDSMRAGSPFGLLAQTIRRACNMANDEPPDVQQRKLALRVSRHVPESERARVTEFLAEPCGVPFASDVGVQLRAARQDAMLMSDQIRRAWEDFVQAECREHFVLLVLEDLQWGDLPTVKLVSSALSGARELPLMVLGVARPEVHDLFPGLWSDRGVQKLTVGGLSRRAGAGLARGMLGDSASDAEIDRIVERAGGNSFYLEELIRAHAEGRYAALPETVLAMVQSRLEAMEPEARRVLRAASVFGQVSWLGGVTELLGGPGYVDEAREWLTELETREVISRRSESRFSGETEYAFRHALVREAAYAMLTDADRLLGHRLAGQWLAGAGESDASLLAEHLEQGGQRERAVPWWLAAAESALDASDFDAAAEHAQRGVGCDAEGEALGALLLVLAEAERWRGAPDYAERTARQAMRLLPRGGARFCHAAAELALLYQRLGRPAELERIARELLELRDVEAPDALAIAALRAAVGLLLAGERGLATELVGAVRRRGAREPESPVTQAWLCIFDAIEALHAGDLSRYLEQERAALEHYEHAGDLRRALNESVSVGYAYMELGAYREAEQALTSALDAAERSGLSHPAAAARHNLGLVMAHLGRVDEGIETERVAIATFVMQQDLRLEAAGRIYLACIHLLAGQHELAAHEADRGVALAREAAPPVVPMALAALSQARLAEGRASEALEGINEALERVRASGEIEGGDSLLHLLLAETLYELGDQAGARRAIATAKERLLERAGRIRDPALRRSFLENVPDNARTLERARAWSGGNA